MRPRVCLSALAAVEDRSACFDDGEARRLAAMQSPRRRGQFVAGHSLARRMLAESSASDPSSWQWRTDARGAPKPWSANAGARMPALSLSHSGDWVACAVAAQRIGVDIEFDWRARDLLALAAHAFSPREAADIEALSPVLRGEHFYLLWTLREAAAKRDGVGLDAASSRRQRAMRCDAGDAVLVAWNGQGWAMSVAVESPDRVETSGLPADAVASFWRLEAAPTA
jgi:4'-phosphopantetheinyl transferase